MTERLGVTVTTEGLGFFVVTEGAELLPAGPDSVMVMISAEVPGPPGTVTVNTVATSDSAVVVNGVDSAGAVVVPTVVSKVSVKLAVLIE